MSLKRRLLNEEFVDRLTRRGRHAQDRAIDVGHGQAEPGGDGGALRRSRMHAQSCRENRLDRPPEKGYIWRAMTVRELLDAIHALPRPDRLRLVEQLNGEAVSDRLSSDELQPPPGSMLDLVDGFYVYTGLLADAALDHRVDREARIDHVIACLNAPRS